MTLDNIIATRRSVRHFKPDAIERDVLEQVLNAGRLAPSARNLQTWRFTVVLNKELMAQLQGASVVQPILQEVPAVIAVWSTDDRTMQCGQPAATVDCSIALTHMMLKATELGLGTCWLGLFDADEAARVLDLPDDAQVVALMPIGYADPPKNPSPRKPLEEIIDIRE